MLIILTSRLVLIEIVTKQEMLHHFINVKRGEETVGITFRSSWRQLIVFFTEARTCILIGACELTFIIKAMPT